MIKPEHFEKIKSTKLSSLDLLDCSGEKINAVLLMVKNKILENINNIILENKKDLENFAKKFTINHPSYDRLILNEDRINKIVNGLVEIAEDSSLDNEIIEEKQTQDGLFIQKVSVPFGTILVIYESRPNVTIDVFGLCFKSRNTVLLRGGSEAIYSNTIFVNIIKSTLREFDLNENFVNLLTTEREDVVDILKEVKYIDLCIPRGGSGLINFIKNNTKIPMIETGAGIVNAYLDENFDLDMAKRIIFDSKTRMVSACNALDCLIINKNALNLASEILNPLESKNVILYCDDKVFNALNGKYKYLERLTEETEGIEFLDYKMSCIAANDINEAIEYIGKHTSFHTELILTNDENNAKLFQKLVDASVVYVNTSTGFTDGFRFGLGAEIGISTQKLHARGPMGVSVLRTYKYRIKSSGVAVIR